jgi:hypothetical protein
VSPLVAGKVVDDEGFTTKSFKPAYAKDKRRFDPSRPFKRSIGEKSAARLSPQQRLEANINRTLIQAAGKPDAPRGSHGLRSLAHG